MRQCDIPLLQHKGHSEIISEEELVTSVSEPRELSSRSVNLRGDVDHSLTVDSISIWLQSLHGSRELIKHLRIAERRILFHRPRPPLLHHPHPHIPFRLLLHRAAYHVPPPKRIRTPL